MRFPAVLLGVLVRVIGRKGASYWEKRCELLGVLVRFSLWITFLLGLSRSLSRPNVALYVPIARKAPFYAVSYWEFWCDSLYFGRVPIGTKGAKSCFFYWDFYYGFQGKGNAPGSCTRCTGNGGILGYELRKGSTDNMKSV